MKRKDKIRNDEWYTLEYAVLPLLEYIPKGSTILCPFDLWTSEFVQVFLKKGYEVIYSHIDSMNPKDFFTYTKEEVKEFDYIISNPPYSLRKQVMSKLEELQKPYAMLIPLVSVALKDIRINLHNNELLVFDKRLKFKDYNGKINSAASEICYLCKGVLPKQIIFKEIKE